MVRPIDYAALTERTCTKCKITKPVAEFNKHDDPKQPINGWRYYSWCRECQNAASRDYGTTDRERRNKRLRQWRKQNSISAAQNDRRKHIKYKYNITADDADQMFAEQRSTCLICLEVSDLVIDHDHETGEVRGGLCSPCNVRLGRVEAIPSWAEKHPLGKAMLAYLDPVQRKRRAQALAAEEVAL